MPFRKKVSNRVHYLIDYENTNYYGLEGAEFLKKDDKVTIFFSEPCKLIPNYKIEQIINSGCILDICKLQNTGRNALDYYIASKVGEIFACDPWINVVIVSKDKGYRAVRDYWWNRLNVKTRLVIRTTMAEGLLASNENPNRKVGVKEAMERVSIEDTFNEYRKRKEIENELYVVFDKTPYMKIIPEIMNIIAVNHEPKKVYTSSLKTFGKEAGLDIYRGIRECFDRNIS